MIFLSYLFYFVAASASPLQRRWLAKTKNIDNTGQIAFAFHVSLVISLLSFGLLLYQPFVITGNVFFIASLAILCGVSGSLGAILLYVSVKHVEAGVTTLVINVYTPITIILATLFLNERLTSMQILGTVILFLGILIVSKKHKTGRFTFDKYFLMVLSSGVLLGVLITIERYLQKTTGFTTAAMLSWWSVCICLGLLTFFSKNKHTYSTNDIFLTGGLRFLQNLSWAILVFTVGNLSLVSAITTFKVIIMFGAGALLLHERDDLMRKILGSVVAVVGLLLVR